MLRKKFEKKKLKVGKVNVEDGHEIAQKFGVSSIPNFVMFKDGKVIANFVGAMSEEDFAEKKRSFCKISFLYNNSYKLIIPINFMDFESNMDNGYLNEVSDSPQRYFITYKNLVNGSTAIVSGEAISRCNAEELFNSKIYNCEVIKIQTRDEWIEDIGMGLAKDLMKHIKTLENLVEKKN
jgi:hypothetical protein